MFFLFQVLKNNLPWTQPYQNLIKYLESCLTWIKAGQMVIMAVDILESQAKIFQEIQSLQIGI